MSEERGFRVHFTKVTLEYFVVETDVYPAGPSMEYVAEQQAKMKLRKDQKRYQTGANHVSLITTGVTPL